jgi:hypothetical protein
MWVVSIFRSVSAMWENYEALVFHFVKAKINAAETRKTDACTRFHTDYFS